MSQPLTLNQVFAAHFSSEPAGLLLSTGLVKLTVCATSQLIMLLLPVWASMLLGLLLGFLPLVGMEPMGGAKPDSGHTPNPEPPPSSSDSNCSQLTLKLEFSSKVVEHGKKNLFKLVDVFSIKTLPHRESGMAFMKIRSVIVLHDIFQTNK